MARLPRVRLIGVPQHIIQRCIHGQVCFVSEQDFTAYINWLQHYAAKFDVEIHAWVIMPDHVHLLCTPRIEKGISAMLQGLGRQYVRYFNDAYQRSGTLWEGRFKSCLVEPETYLLELYRYIELNPVRAGIVEHPSQYAWSSYQVNALGKKSALCTPHEQYLSLAKDELKRQKDYRILFNVQIDDQLLDDIRRGVNKSMAIGSNVFKQQIENLTGRQMTERKRGRPAGWAKH